METPWEKTKKIWDSTKNRETRSIFIYFAIEYENVSQKKVDKAGGISSLAQRNFNGLPVFMCDGIVRLRIYEDKDK